MKSGEKVLPIDIRARRQKALIVGIGEILARDGFRAASPDGVSEVSGVPRSFIYKEFGGMAGLVRAFATNGGFCPTAQDLIGDDEEELRALSPAELMSEFFRRYTAAILNSPQTLEIMAWESMERTPLCDPLEDVRMRTALEFFDLMKSDPPDDVDVTALVLIIAGAVQYLAVRSRTNRFLGGVELRSEQGWQRIDETIERILESLLSDPSG